MVENFSHQNGFKIFQLIKRYKYLIELKFPTKFIILKINGSFHCTLYKAPWDFYWWITDMYVINVRGLLEYKDKELCGFTIDI